MLNQGLTTEQLHTNIQRVKERNPDLENIIGSFEELILAKNSLKEELSSTMREIKAPDMDRLASGVPALSDLDAGSRFPEMDTGFQRMLEALEAGFPNLKRETAALRLYIKNNPDISPKWLDSIIFGDDQTISDTADELNIDMEITNFMLEQCLKPYLETLSGKMSPYIEKMRWDQGYCPICGAYPDTTYLRQKQDNQEYLRAHGGQRWLHCSLCSYEWRLRRIVCPYCGNEENDSLEYFHEKNNQHERIYVCHKCKKYITCLDTSQLVDIPLMDLLPFEMLPLDIVAQDMGYHPIVPKLWSKA